MLKHYPIVINVAALMAIATASASTVANAQQQAPASVIQVASVEKAELAPTVAVPGTIYSRNEVQVTAGVAGQLTMVAEPGTYVRKGDAVASIDDTTLLLQRAEQEALLERANINARQLESQLRRQQELSSSNLVSEFELEQTEANRDLAKSDANITRVRIRQIDDQIRRASVLAPFSGLVITRAHRAGEDVARGEVLAQMTDLENMEVRAFVPLKHLPRTVVGDTIAIFATNMSAAGHIRALVPTGDVRSQTFEARINLSDNASENWTVGQLVSVAVPIRARSVELTVPRDALVLRHNGAFVFRVSSENLAEQIAVSVGDSDGDRIAVSGPLREGDRVAIRGAENLREGSTVRIMLSESDSAAGVSGSGSS